MKKIEFALCVGVALFAPVFVGTSAAQSAPQMTRRVVVPSAAWTASSSPVQATIAGGPWTLGQGGASTTGGAYDGTIPYCTPGNSSGGTPLMNSASVVNTFNPYYFPWVVGSGQSVKGYFDYRPKDINEAVVEAISADAGKTWTFQQMAEQLTNECPNSDSNTANDTAGNPAGNDNGEGHASLISFSGINVLYTLDRRPPHVDSDGLIVHDITPRGANALNPLPTNSPFMQPPDCVSGSAPSGNCVQPMAPLANVIAGWDFNNISGAQLTPAPSTNNSHGTVAASALGMTNSYVYSTQAVTIHTAGTGYAVNDTGTFGSGATYTVTSITGGGATGPVKAATVSQLFSPTYTVGTNYPATATTGSGSGLVLKVSALTTTGSTNGDDVTDTNLSSDPLLVPANNSQANNNIAPNDNGTWRVRGSGGATGNNGWNLSAPPCTQGAQFMLDTTGFYNIVLQFDWYTTNQGVRDLQVLYTTNSGTNWTPVGPIQVSGGGSAFNNQITINFKALNITGVENNSGFGVQFVSVFDPDYLGTPAYSAPGGNVCSSAGTGTYTAASLAGNNQPVQYNNNSGNWRFDEVNFFGSTDSTDKTYPITNDPVVNTTGLVNPDGILAVVPNTYPIKVLYISKTLNSDYVAPTNYPLCPPSVPNGNLNDDVEVVRIATTSNFVNFTDITPTNPVPSSTTGQTIQMVAGLSDPATTSYSGIRWVSPNGTLIKLSSGNWGLFFGGGNCLDGDSDAFHAIMYAESPDLENWTVINGINNPIASIAQQTGLTDPQTGATGVTIPASTPVIGQSVAGGQFDWFSGRVYGPQAIVTSPLP